MCAVSLEIGSVIRLLSSSRTNLPVELGDNGVVWGANSSGSYHVLWDNGCQFDLDPKTDRWEVVSDESLEGEAEHEQGKGDAWIETRPSGFKGFVKTIIFKRGN